ncbi:NAD(P)H-quinone oxidoreductase [Homoserinimonas sp. A447]
MKAIVCLERTSQMSWVEVEDPEPQDDEVVIEVAATALNRADLAQRKGNYPVPAGASPILGLECSGIISEVGSAVTEFRVGDRVMALLTGGGYAQRVAVPRGQVMHVPANIDMVTAAAFPEAACTVYSNLIVDGGLAEGRTVLIHGGGSGIGTMAISVAKAFGAKTIVTAGSDQRVELCRNHGADLAVNYNSVDFVSEARSFTGGRGVDMVLDCVGADYLERNLSATADDGTVLVIGLQGGAESAIDLSPLMRRRLTLRGSTIRARSVSDKARIVDGTRSTIVPLLVSGEVSPVIDSSYEIEAVAEAHQYMEQRRNFGKMVLLVNVSIE